MASRALNVTRDQEGIYHLRGELSIHKLEQFKEFLEKLVEKEAIALSLDEVDIIDTPALQLLIAFRRRFEPEGRFRIVEVSPEVDRVLALAGLEAALMAGLKSR